MWPRWTSIPVGSIPYLHPERRAGRDRLLELPGEFGLGRDRVDPSAEDLELFGGIGGHSRISPG